MATTTITTTTMATTATAVVSVSASASDSKKRRRLPAPHTFETLYSSYHLEWEQRRKSIPLHVDVSDLVWVDIDPDPQHAHLVACTSLGQIVVWKSNTNTETNENEETNSSSSTSMLDPKPVVKLAVSSKPLNSLQVIFSSANDDDDEESNPLLLVAGDEGLWSMTCQDLLLQAQQEQQPNETSPIWTHHSNEPIRQIQAYDRSVYTLSSATNMNMNMNKVDQYDVDIVDVDVVKKNKKAKESLFPSPTTNLTLVKSYPVSHGETATTMAVTASPSGNPLLLVGTSQSSVLIWDLETQKALEPLSVLVSNKKQNGSINRSTTVVATTTTTTTNQECSVTSIACTQDQWWTISGKYNKGNNGVLGNGAGFLATWHGPTRTLVSRVETGEVIQRVIVGSQDNAVYAVGNQARVHVWESPYQLSVLEEEKEDQENTVTTSCTTSSSSSSSAIIWSSAPSGKAVAASSVSASRVAVAGVGPKVDILQNSCRVQTLEVY